MQTSSEKLRELRKGKFGENKSLAARACKISQSAYWSAENRGCKELKAANFLQICKEFNVNPEWLMNGKGPKHPYALDLPDIAAEIARTWVSLPTEWQAQVQSLIVMAAKFTQAQTPDRPS